MRGSGNHYCNCCGLCWFLSESPSPFNRRLPFLPFRWCIFHNGVDQGPRRSILIVHSNGAGLFERERGGLRVDPCKSHGGASQAVPLSLDQRKPFQFLFNLSMHSGSLFYMIFSIHAHTDILFLRAFTIFVFVLFPAFWAGTCSARRRSYLIR